MCKFSPRKGHPISLTGGFASYSVFPQREATHPDALHGILSIYSMSLADDQLIASSIQRVMESLNKLSHIAERLKLD